MFTICLFLVGIASASSQAELEKLQLFIVIFLENSENFLNFTKIYGKFGELLIYLFMFFLIFLDFLENSRKIKKIKKTNTKNSFLENPRIFKNLPNFEEFTNFKVV